MNKPSVVPIRHQKLGVTDKIQVISPGTLSTTRFLLPITELTDVYVCLIGNPGHKEIRIFGFVTHEKIPKACRYVLTRASFSSVAGTCASKILVKKILIVTKHAVARYSPKNPVEL